MTREITQSMSDADLNDPHKVALYGIDVINREIAFRQQRQATMNLRWSEDEHPDTIGERDWLADPLRKAGITAHRVMCGDPFEDQLRARRVRDRREVQPVEDEVVEGCAIALPNGICLGGGTEIKAEVLGKRPELVLAQLRTLGFVSSVGPRRAWVNALPADVGPYVVAEESLTIGNRTLKRGQPIDESMFPALVRPKKLTDDMPASALTVADLRRLIAGEIAAKVPEVHAAMMRIPPPFSEWSHALHEERVVLNPQYRSAPTKEKALK